MGFEDIDGLDGVLVATLAVCCAHCHGCVNHHVCKEVTVDGDYLWGLEVGYELLVTESQSGEMGVNDRSVEETGAVISKLRGSCKINQ